MVVKNSKNMYKFNIILFFYFVGIIYAVETNDPTELKESADDHAVQSLVEIQPGKALPLVFFKTNFKKLLFPTNLDKVMSLDGKMVQGTQFTYKSGHDQIFFCPENSTDRCLAPKIFDEREPLQCAWEPTPLMESENTKCGDDKMDIFHKLVYRICESTKYQFVTKEVPFYGVCYNTKIKKTLFTIHSIQSPELIYAKLLWRERQTDYHMMTMDQLTDNSDFDKKSTSQYSTTKSDYQWRKLVPSEDMALRSWRKTTFQETNIALQHQQLINLWDKLSEHVRSHAREMSTKNTRTFVFTGVFDLDSAYEDDGDDQLSNIWVKLIVTTKSISNDLSKATNGVAILMNNFINKKPGSSTPLNLQAIEGYCDQDGCIDTLKNEFNQVKGEVRCCSVTKKILDLFNEKYVNLPELYIPDVNISKGQEILNEMSWNYYTVEGSAKVIREIRPREILPLILHLNPDDFKLYFPRTIKKIVTKKKRIVDGSQFSHVNYEEQLFFCPTENPDEKCLAPRTFGRFEPLQCTNEMIPVVKPLFIESNEVKCGIDDRGTLYEVVYEICPSQPPYEYETTQMKLYEFCYDPEKKQILYTNHRIFSPALLTSRLLFRERNIEYATLEDSKLPLSNLEELQAAFEESKNSNSSTNENKPAYKLQNLVPSEDMAFASWKRSTYQYTNVALQHEKLFPIWNTLNKNIKNMASMSQVIKGNVEYHHSENSIYTGVFHIPSRSSSNDPDFARRSEIWFKIVHTQRIAMFHEPEGIVILMYNFIIPKTSQSESSNTKKNILEVFCEENLCSENFKNEYDAVGGQVRCCKWTKKIALILGIPMMYDETEPLLIGDLISNQKYAFWPYNRYQEWTSK